MGADYLGNHLFFQLGFSTRSRFHRAMVGQKSVGGGGIGQPLHWTDRERKLWIIVLFICSILVYAARTSLSVSIVEMASEFDWNKKTCVSVGGA